MDYKDTLDRAIFGLEEALGRFMTSGAEIMRQRDRAAGYKDASDAAIRSRSQAITTKANGLITDFKSIQVEGAAALAKANTLKTQMETDPFWKNILTSPWDNLGWETLKRAKLAVGSITGIASDMNDLRKRMDKHMSNVAGLQADVKNLEDAAQGKGVLQALSSGVGSAAAFYKGMVGKPLMIFAGVAAVALFWPQIMKGTVGAFRK